MNWFSIRRNVVVTAEMDCCEHLKEGDTAIRVSCEMDSFGMVGAYATCEPCTQVAVEREGAEEVVCHDCGLPHPKRDTIAWRWYDFYAPQGDEPIIVCEGCQKKDKHILRVKKDDADAEAEWGDE